MEWIGDIFHESGNRDSLHNFYGTIHEEVDPSYQAAPSTSMEDIDIGSDSDNNEDVDRAIALSLSEEIRRNEVEKEAQLAEDELLAKAIQESLNLEISSEDETEDDSSQFEDCHSEQGNEIEDCHSEQGNEIEDCHSEEGNEIEDEIHPEPVQQHWVSDNELQTPINYPNFDHRSYYNNNPQCDVCKYYIPKNPYGHLEYRSHPFWLQKYCISHEHDGTPRCCSCERMKSRDNIFIGLDDGRKLCLECSETAIMNTDGCQPLYLEIKKFYEGLGMKLEQQVPLLLVERQALNEAREGEKDGHHDMPETRGICLSEEQSVSRRPKTKGGRSHDVEAEPHKLKRHCEVTAILILHGLPRLLTGTILAHELMHAWLRLGGYQTLRPEVEEGICQVIAFMWLEKELRFESFDSKLGQFIKESFESDTSPAYGEGFRVGWQSAQKYGLKQTLEHIRKTGNFPY